MVRSIAVETWLKSEGVSWEYHDSEPLSSIDIQGSLQNKGRIGRPLDDELVLQYAIAMQDGAAFPGLIAHKTSKGWMLITGNHRVAAALEAGRKEFDLYEVISNDEYVLERLTRTANSIEGRRDTREELLEQGKYLVRHYGRSIQETERALHLPKGTLGNALRQDEGRARLAATGIDTSRYPKNVVERLNSIATNEGMAALAQLVKDASITAGPLFESLVTEVNKIKSETGQLALVSNLRQRSDIAARIAESRTGRAGRINSPRTRLLASLGMMRTVIDRNPTLESLGLTNKEDLERFSESASSLSGRLMKLAHDAREKLS